MNRKAVWCALLAVLLVFLGVGCNQRAPIMQKQLESTDKKSLQIAISQETREVIERSLRKTQIPFNWSSQTKGIIVPHHLLQADLIAKCFSGLKDLDPQVVVILSPNHKKMIEHGIITVNLNLKTYKGLMTTSSITNDLIDEGLAANTPHVLVEEYGLSNLFPYIQAMPWHAEMIPMITSRGLTDQEIGDVYDVITKKTKGKRVLWIASIDFSHGLSALESRGRDAETLEWMAKGSVDRILSSGPEHMDNPSGLILWLKAMKSFKRIYHGESGSRTEEAIGEAGTSYLIFEGL